MKKILLLVPLLTLLFHHPVTAEPIETGEEFEVKDIATKSFIYNSLNFWIFRESSDFYHKKYNANSVMPDPMEMKDIRIWIKEVKRQPGSFEYTHIVRIYLPFDGIILNEKIKMKTADTLIFAVNTDYIAFANCSNPHLFEKTFELLDYYHKVIEK
ncbi:hypothetical protein [Neobacillus citreus]|uniref:Uncharacterized protein n=1 Tax=Neobacillus citreus TaxID=2833578 RepID=A0A942T5D0_9BACI|nr:hypothetical protein [Neobacillus citreus]MCH6269525.1 hypothetical protein [Neobacillus citreus]